MAAAGVVVAKSEPGRGSYASPGALACVVIDPVRDFMAPDGAFAANLGVEDTAPVRAIGPELDAVVASCRAYG